MPTVEIDEGQLNTLRAAYALLDTLQSKPQTKRAFEKMIKDHVAPNVVTSDEAAEPFVAPLRDELAEVKGKLKEITDGNLDREFNERFSKVARQHSLTEDGEKTLKDYMIKKKIADPEDAVLAWKGRQPAEPIRPSGMESAGWNFGELDNKEDTAAMLNDTDNYFDGQAAKIWNEVKNQAA